MELSNHISEVVDLDERHRGFRQQFLSSRPIAGICFLTNRELPRGVESEERSKDEAGVDNEFRETAVVRNAHSGKHGYSWDLIGRNHGSIDLLATWPSLIDSLRFINPSERQIVSDVAWEKQ